MKVSKIRLFQRSAPIKSESGTETRSADGMERK